LDRFGTDRSRRRRRLTSQADDRGIEIVCALQLGPGPDAHPVAKEEDGLGLGFTSAASRLVTAGCDAARLLRHSEIRQGEAGGSHGREQYPVG
jgi:hypothetical protein